MRSLYCTIGKIKGFTVEVMKTAYDRGHDPIEFTMVHINKKLKKLNCPGGKLMLAHKSGEEKSSVSFFIKHNLHYQERGLKCFRATVLESYGKFWMMKFWRTIHSFYRNDYSNYSM